MAHTYKTPGHYVATVTAQNELGAVQTTVGVDVLDAPIAGLSAYGILSALTPGRVDFTASISQGTNAIYQWDFGDGASITAGPNVSHIYPAQAIYTATLTVSNSAGYQKRTIRVDTFKYHSRFPFIQASP